MREERRKVVERFVEDRCYCDSNEEVLFTELWKEFWDWSCENNSGVSRAYFPIMLERLGFRKWWRNRKMYILGISVRKV